MKDSGIPLVLHDRLHFLFFMAHIQLILHPSLMYIACVVMYSCSSFQQVSYPPLQAFKQKVVSLQPQRLFSRLPNDLSLSLLMLGSGWGRWNTIECFFPSSSACVNVKHEPPPGMTEQPASTIAETNSVQ
jgi:hypothetical protein